jgi:hypothetical protein
VLSSHPQNCSFNLRIYIPNLPHKEKEQTESIFSLPVIVHTERENRQNSPHREGERVENFHNQAWIFYAEMIE